MSILKRALDFIKRCRAIGENPEKFDERGGIAEYPGNIELRQW